ncbi:hypothetical protein DRN46_01770 [Thermococci archaeon]|nr:MAG: hypothetical protein DRN46_01770 [Thermococci archaeon]RLF94229.1 MAG: hypothetical protein DRN52_05395 [Thermococci archaeon]
MYTYERMVYEALRRSPMHFTQLLQSLPIGERATRTALRRLLEKRYVYRKKEEVSIRDWKGRTMKKRLYVYHANSI